MCFQFVFGTSEALDSRVHQKVQPKFTLDANNSNYQNSEREDVGMVKKKPFGFRFDGI